MSPDSLRYRLGELGLSQRGCARLLQVNTRTVRRWCSGGQPIADGVEGRLLDVSADEVVDATRGGAR